MISLPTLALISHAMLALRHFGGAIPPVSTSTRPPTLQSASGILEVCCPHRPMVGPGVELGLTLLANQRSGCPT